LATPQYASDVSDEAANGLTRPVAHGRFDP
jgi:hypothetical protein